MVDTFSYNGTNMLEAFGIKVVHYDLLNPPLRERKQVIPFRSGAYDLGALHHEERQLVLECRAEKKLDLHEMDEVKFLLSKKGRIELWDKPERHYMGQLVSPTAVEDQFNQSVRKFELLFTCEPYLTGNTPVELEGSPATVEYKGTRRTPTRITIKNTGTVPLRGVRVTLISKE